MRSEDLKWLREIVERHHRLTGSAVAVSLLGDWPRRSASFTKIMPRDYQRVLEAERSARAEGRDVDAAIMEAELAANPSERFLAAHLAALRVG